MSGIQNNSQNVMSKKSPQTSRPTRNDAQRQSIIDAASLLFIEKGFGGTNINDIADAVGVSRTALYYYFPSKESILETLTEEVTEKAGNLAKSVSARDGLAPDQALRQLILQHAGLILSHPLQFRVVERSESSLPETHRATAENSRRAVFANFVRTIKRGIDDGSFRQIDPHVAAFSIIGMCNWCAWWFDPSGEVAASDVAESIAMFGLQAVSADKPRKARTKQPTSTEEALSLIREGLNLLEAQGKKPSKKF